MSIFTSTHHLINETPLTPSTTLSTALALLHDHIAFENLQPLVVANVPLPTPPPASSYLFTKTNSLSPTGVTPEYRSVTAAIPFGPFSNNVTSTSAFINTEDGVIIVFQAPMGLYGVNTWKVVRSIDEGGKEGLVLREEAELTGPTILMPFVLATEKESHKELGLAFAKKLMNLAH